MQLTIFDYLPQAERNPEICAKFFKPKARRGLPRRDQAEKTAQIIAERIQAEPIAIEPPATETQTDSTTQENRLQPFSEYEWVCYFCDSKMRFRYISDNEVGFDCSKNPKHLLKISYSGMHWSHHTGGNAGPLPDMLGYYFKGEFTENEKALILLAFDLRAEKTGKIEDEQYRKHVFLETGKVVNLYVERELARVDKAKIEIEKTDSTPVSSPSVTAPEPAAKVVLGIPLGHSHPGLGINKPVCFYCKGQAELEYAGLFPNAIKSMNHHIWRCKKQPRHQLVCAEKGDWWYQWCGGVGYGVTYGVPELWMWKDVFQAATGQEPELTPEPEIDECSELCQTIPCETCSELSLSVFDISSQKLTNRTVLLKSTELNELISETQKTSVCEISEELKKRGLYAPDFLIQAILGGEPNTQALEAAELRAKIAEVHEIRLRQKKVEELKRQREQIGKKISEVMGRGFSRINDEEAAHFQKKYDRASEAIRALEEQIPTIIPATWRWEERLKEIEKQIEEKLK